jgi:hypothetical protein
MDRCAFCSDERSIVITDGTLRMLASGIVNNTAFIGRSGRFGSSAPLVRYLGDCVESPPSVPCQSQNHVPPDSNGTCRHGSHEIHEMEVPARDQTNELAYDTSVPGMEDRDLEKQNVRQ